MGLFILRRRRIGMTLLAGTLATAGILLSIRPGNGDRHGNAPPDTNAPVEVSSHPPRQDETPALRADLEALRREVKFLRADMNDMNRRWEELAQRLASAPRDPEPASGVSGFDPRAGSEATIREHQRLDAERERAALVERTSIETVFQSEIENPAWSRETRSAIENAIAAMSQAPDLAHDVECRATSCRVRVTHHNVDEQQQFINEFSSRVADDFPSKIMNTVANDDGSATASIYLTRAGRDFPELPMGE